MNFQNKKYLFTIIATLACYQKILISCSTLIGGKSISLVRNDTESTRQAVSALVGGEIAQIGQFPWMAVVHRLQGDGKISMCGGTILSVRWVLTAGHCVVGSPRKFFVVFGEINKNNIGYDFYHGAGIAMMTTKGAFHPQYGKTVNDIALLYMPRDIPLGGAIQTIRLKSSTEKYENFAERTAIIVGWGKDGPTSSGSTHLKFGQISVISNSECAKTWNVDSTVICTAARTGTDACQGDSGGPLLIRDSGEYIQIGIVSYGDADCQSARPGVFTRVSSFSKWIKEITGIQY